MEKKSLNTFLLVGIFVSTILSIRNWPVSAEYGFSSLFFILLAAFCFLIPVAMVSAELATGWPEKGGIFAWIKQAFGYRAGFSASWFVWISNVVWYPTILSFIAGSIAYTFSPKLAENKFVIFGLTNLCFWSVIYLNSMGTKISGWISSICLIIGTIIPGIVIILFGLDWLSSGHPIQFQLKASQILPKFNQIGDFVFFAGILLGFAGMEMPAAHASEVKDPQKNYPKAIFISASVIILLSILGTFSVGLVIPQEKINLISAPLDAISIFLAAKNLQWLVPLMSAFLALGALGGVSTWIAGPSKSLLQAARGYDLPKFLLKQNKHQMPTGIFILQGTIVSILSFLFLIMPNLNSGFWILTALASQLYLMAYILLFAAAIVLRYTHSDVVRKYRVSKSNAGIWMVGSIGIVNAILAIVIGFFPPSQIDVGGPFRYFLFMALGISVFSFVPFALRQKRVLQT